MKPIVLATDGSPSAAEATLHAVELARALGTTLIVVSVEQQATKPGAVYPGYASVLAELTKGESERVAGTLEQAAAIAAEAGVACDSVHARGPVPDAICRVAWRRDARMIVVGAHGWGPVRRVLHGSVSTAVVHEARCPVLVVPAGPERLDEHVELEEHAAVS
jgi:nucleotide-binding universal stress UspA family protein